MPNAKIVVSSEDSLQIQFDQNICSEVNYEISLFVETFGQFTRDIPEIKEIVPTYCSVTIYFDNQNCKVDLIIKIAQEVLDNLNFKDKTVSFSSKVISIPVCYDDLEFAPDLENVAKHGNLTKEQVIKIHSSTEYLIYMLGFLPGFPYLGGLDERLETPRLETPRTKIPAGSVAIGGKQTGLYSVESPGGWQIIGRTPLKVFDINRTPEFLYKAGDKLKFIPISRKEFDEFDEELWLKENFPDQSSEEKKQEVQKYVCSSGIKILQPGVASTIQDSGISGYQKFGIGQSGVMDYESYSLANRICGNSENSACIETMLTGPEIKFISSCDFCITGAEFVNATLNNKPVVMNKKIHAEAGQILFCGFAGKGLRSYIAFSGGILVPKVFNSCSTNIKGKFGGYMGRSLQSGDELAIGYCSETEYSDDNQIRNPFFTEKEDVVTIKCIKSSQFDFFSESDIKIFTTSMYTVSPESDRMGIRFTGMNMNCGKTDIISDAIPFGAVQITSSGLPVVMAADRQTTGGYAKIACVTKLSMCKLAQTMPGTKVRFEFVEI